MSAAAIEALGAVAGSLAWTHYRELLNLFMRVMQRNDSKVGSLLIQEQLSQTGPADDLAAGV